MYEINYMVLNFQLLKFVGKFATKCQVKLSADYFTAGRGVGNKSYLPPKLQSGYILAIGVQIFLIL